MDHETIRFTRQTTHHFFAVGGDLHSRSFMRPNVTDPDGTILVFLNRDAAEAEARKRFGPLATVLVIGMGDEKWRLFQQNEKHRVVED